MDNIDMMEMSMENLEAELEIETEDEDYPLNEYQLTTTPNDFNILTIISCIESGVFKIPSFQRHYVWDLKRASKLIESLEKLILSHNIIRNITMFIENIS